MKKIWNILVVFSILFTGCDYLDLVPEDDIETVETIFEKRENADLWVKTCYSFLQQNTGSVTYDPAFTGTDELVAGDYLRKEVVNTKGASEGLFIADGLQMSQEPYGNLWKSAGYYTAIRYCNIFIDKIEDVYNMPIAEKRQWTAEIKALKAHFYYELMRRYGPIILVPQNIDVTESISIMQQPRSPFDDCVNAAIGLLDEAMEYLLPLNEKDMSRWGYYSIEAASALKAKILLLAASPLFNGNPAYASFKNKEGVLLFNPKADPGKWKRAAEAADSAILVCTRYGKKLRDESATKATALLNTMNDIENSVLAPAYVNDEALYMIRPISAEYDIFGKNTLPYISVEVNPTQYNEKIKGCLAPSIKMVEMYYTSNGLPIDEDKEWDYSSRYQMGRESDVRYRDVVPTDVDVLNLHLRREPRFYACIAADRCYWQRGPQTSNLMQVKAYRGEEFGTTFSTVSSSVPQNLTGYWLKKGTYSNVTGQNYIASGFGVNQGLVLIRLAELYLIQAEAWNEYEGPSQDRVYAPLDKIRERAGVPGVVEAWTEHSLHPDKVKTKEGMREIIRREWNVEFAFEGLRFWNLRRWLTAQDELNEKQYGWNVIADNARAFYNNFDKPIPVWTKRKFLAPRDYLFPLRSEEVLVSGMVQNPGW